MHSFAARYRLRQAIRLLEFVLVLEREIGVGERAERVSADTAMVGLLERQGIWNE